MQAKVATQEQVPLLELLRVEIRPVREPVIEERLGRTLDD